MWQCSIQNFTACIGLLLLHQYIRIRCLSEGCLQHVCVALGATNGNRKDTADSGMGNYIILHCMYCCQLAALAAFLLVGGLQHFLSFSQQCPGVFYWIIKCQLEVDWSCRSSTVMRHQVLLSIYFRYCITYTCILNQFSDFTKIVSNKPYIHQ